MAESFLAALSQLRELEHRLSNSAKMIHGQLTYHREHSMWDAPHSFVSTTPWADSIATDRWTVQLSERERCDLLVLTGEDFHPGIDTQIWPRRADRYEMLKSDSDTHPVSAVPGIVITAQCVNRLGSKLDVKTAEDFRSHDLCIRFEAINPRQRSEAEFVIALLPLCEEQSEPFVALVPMSQYGPPLMQAQNKNTLMPSEVSFPARLLPLALSRLRDAALLQGLWLSPWGSHAIEGWVPRRKKVIAGSRKDGVSVIRIREPDEGLVVTEHTLTTEETLDLIDWDPKEDVRKEASADYEMQIDIQAESAPGEVMKIPKREPSESEEPAYQGIDAQATPNRFSMRLRQRKSDV